MKLKELQGLLQDVQPFKQAKPALEQYPTGPHLAACMLYTIDSTYDDLQGKTVIDLGSGTGMLSIGCALLGAAHVVGLELDADALEVAQDNVQQYDEPLPVPYYVGAWNVEQPLQIDFVNVNLRELVPDLTLEAGQEQSGGDASVQQGRGAGLGRRGKGGRSSRQQQRQGIRQERGRHGQAQARWQAAKESDESGEEQSEKEEEEDEEEEESDGKETAAEGSKDGRGIRVDVGSWEGRRLPDQSMTGLQASAQQLGLSEVATSDDAGNDSNLQGQQAGTVAPHRRPVHTCSVPILQHLKADTCVLNPPFGTKGSWGIDMLFLKAAFRMCKGCVYSLHKSSTRQHIHTVATKQLGAVQAAVVAELQYDLPATMKFHKQQSKDIEVDLWRFEVGPK